ncbi:esterase/lipase family protein [Elusimicrobiota bacterium]
MSYRYPIIFVHGIQGSWLKNQYPVDYQNEICWTGILIKKPQLLHLNPQNPAVDEAVESFVAPHQAVPFVYESFVDELREEVTPYTFVFTYDWRKDNRASAIMLAAYVEGVLQKVNTHERQRWQEKYRRDKKKLSQFREIKKVTLIGHSMGGLVIKWYVMNHLGPIATKKIDWIITAATPYRGSLDAVELLLPGARNFFGMESKKALRHAARTMPGAFQLLPSWDGALVTGKTNLSVFDPGIWQDNLVRTLRKEYGPSFLKEKLSEAQEFSEVVSADYPAELRSRFFCIYGEGSSTWKQVRVNRSDGNWFDFQEASKDEHGDGTVHACSSRVKASKYHKEGRSPLRDLVGGQHAQILNHGGVQDAVVKCLTQNQYIESFESPR